MDTTLDQFLGGALRLEQPKTGYRAGVDPVLLAAACPAKAGDSILELGCGVGVASLCLGHRVPGLSLSAVEILPDHVELTRKNAEATGMSVDVILGDVANRPTPFFDRHFDHVIMNPPYFEGAKGLAPIDAGRSSGRRETVPLQAWVIMAGKRLRPKGYLTLVQRIERLPEVLRTLEGNLGSIKVLPVAPRVKRSAHLVLVQARKSGRAAFQMLSPLVMHAGAAHGDGYSEEVENILRHGHGLKF
ncbi:MAG: tRNA1(Val) (adenine(37)-N6)-methyltransferase [Planktomarina sp.]